MKQLHILKCAYYYYLFFDRIKYHSLNMKLLTVILYVI